MNWLVADGGILLDAEAVDSIERESFHPGGFGNRRGCWIYAMVRIGPDPRPPLARRLEFVAESYQMANERREAWRLELELLRSTSTPITPAEHLTR